MYADAVAKISESIFPIFFAADQDGAVAMGVSGTGFFVGDDGVFVTVDHIMHCAPPGSTYYYYGKVPDSVCSPAVEIECIARDPDHDLYLGHIAREALTPLELGHRPVRPGDSVCLSGYPMAVVMSNEEGGFVGNVRRYWQPTFVVDAAQASIDGRSYAGYIVEHACFSGMSGGPVFDVEGIVRGMSVANLTRTIPDPGGSGTRVSNGIVADVEYIRQFLRDSTT
jgi:S1-C subfamily serine protease